MGGVWERPDGPVRARAEGCTGEAGRAKSAGGSWCGGWRDLGPERMVDKGS
ncbi:MAG: hypothetical protein PHQ34_13640 [Methanothrix sp.]|nr:hypothetical protein [Methanothrix sp.]